MRTSARNMGFTLVELLLVVTLIAVLSSFLIPGFTNYIEHQNILQAQEILKSDLRTAQNKALTGVGSSTVGVEYWGIKILSDDADTYITFKSVENTSAACTNAVADTKSENLPGDVVVKGASGACIFFSLRNGDAIIRNYGSNIINLGYPDETACYGVEVNSAGMIRGVDLCP